MDLINQLNFNSLLILQNKDLDLYTFYDYEKNGFQHNLIGFCTDCESKGINKCSQNDVLNCKRKKCNDCEKKNFKLNNISHGAHSKDFIISANHKIDTTEWNNDGVMFVMESPSNDYGIYTDLSYKGIEKRPSKQWYWIHNKQDIKGFPDKFKGGEYGAFVASVIFTFKLNNAYMTNLVKCGLNNNDGNNYMGIGCYNDECIKNCFEKFLINEIQYLNAKVIFAFGSQTLNKLNILIEKSSIKNENLRIVGLPHPAGQRRGFKDIYYKSIYFNIILKALKQEGVISRQEAHSLYDLYIDDTKE